MISRKIFCIYDEAVFGVEANIVEHLRNEHGVVMKSKFLFGGAKTQSVFCKTFFFFFEGFKYRVSCCCNYSGY